ncbi:hypothetical protein SPILM97S_01518 [Streptomyces pilosus]
MQPLVDSCRTSGEPPGVPSGTVPPADGYAPEAP